MDPKQLRILKLLTRHLETHVTSWTPSDAEGNELPPILYAMSGKVYRGMTVLTAGDATDAMSILEAPVPVAGAPAAENGVKRLETWTLLVQGFPKDDKLNPSDPAYYMKAATEKALSRLIDIDKRSGDPRYPDEYRFGSDSNGSPLIGALTIGQGVVRPAAQEVSRLAMFYIPLVVSLTTDVTNP